MPEVRNDKQRPSNGKNHSFGGLCPVPDACYCGGVLRRGGLLDLREREEEMCAMEDSRVHSEWAQISGQEKIAGVVREVRSCPL
jgi:hypothetical protein